MSQVVGVALDGTPEEWVQLFNKYVSAIRDGRDTVHFPEGTMYDMPLEVAKVVLVKIIPPVLAERAVTVVELAEKKLGVEIDMDINAVDDEVNKKPKKAKVLEMVVNNDKEPVTTE